MHDVPQEMRQERAAEKLEGLEGWESRPARILGPEHFQLQVDFAKIMAERTKRPLVGMLQNYTALPRSFAFARGSTYREMAPALPELGSDGANVMDVAYPRYAEFMQTFGGHTAEYHPENSHVFGCFYYEVLPGTTAIQIHFSNNENGDTSPLSEEHIEQRKKELGDMVRDIRRQYPQATEVRGLSWLYTVPAYRALFPESYHQSLAIDSDSHNWIRGTTMWGQFIDSHGQLKHDKAELFLAQVEALPPGADVSALFGRADSAVSPVMAAHAPIGDFYTMYGLD